MVLSWIEDVTSEYFRKTGHLVFNNISYFALSPGKKQPAWQEFDVLAIKNKKAKIVSCKRGLGPEEYDKQAKMLLFHRESMLSRPDLEIYRPLFVDSPSVVLVIEYPRPEHVGRITRMGVEVLPVRQLLRDFVDLLYKDLKEHHMNEGKEENYATRLIKSLLHWETVKIANARTVASTKSST